MMPLIDNVSSRGLWNHRATRIFIGLSSLQLTSLADAQVPFENLPTLPPIEDSPGTSEANVPPLPELPTLPPISPDPAITPSTPPSVPPLPEEPELPGLPPLDPSVNQISPSPALKNSNPLVPGSDLVPSPSLPETEFRTPEQNRPDSWRVEAAEDEAPSFLDDEESSESSAGEADAFIGSPVETATGTSLNGAPRDVETEGWGFGLRLLEAYTSNLQLAESDGDATLFTQISPSASFRSAPEGRARTILAASYTPALTFYHSGSEGNTLDHSLESVLTYGGERLEISLTGRYQYLHAANRFTGSFSRSIDKELSVSGRYDYSDKTSLFSDLSWLDRKDDAGEFGGSRIFTWNLSGLYNYSSKLQVGPAFRYAQNNVSAVGTSKSYSLGAELRYQYSEKVSTAATLGLERSSLPGGDSEYAPTFTARLDYKPSPVLRFRGEVRYETIPVTQAITPLRGDSATGSRIGVIDNDDDLNGVAADGGSQLNTVLSVSYRPTQLWRLRASVTRRTAPSLTNPGQSLINNSLNLGASRSLGEDELGIGLAFADTSVEGELRGDSIGLSGDQDFRQLSIFYTRPDTFLENLNFTGELTYSETSGSIEFDQTAAALTFGYLF